jgi:hypothetical protein
MSLDNAPAASTDSVSTASTESVAASPSSSSDTSASTDSRAIAAQLLSGDTESAAPAPQAAEPSDASPTPAAATSGEDDDAQYQALLASGSMPVDRHKAVLTNARNKTRAEVEQEFKAKYGWADTYDRRRADSGLGLLDGLDRNAEHTLRVLAASYGISLTPPAPAAPVEPEGPPPPDVRLDDGSEFYSAKQLAKLNEWQQQQFDKKIAAIEGRVKPFLEKQQLTELREHANVEASSTLAECRAQWPSFQALEGDIKQRMVANPQLNLERAYIQAFAAKGLPALQQQHETDRASQLSRKAAASSAPPSAPRAVTPLRDRERSTADITREVAASAGL